MHMSTIEVSMFGRQLRRASLAFALITSSAVVVMSAARGIAADEKPAAAAPRAEAAAPTPAETAAPTPAEAAAPTPSKPVEIDPRDAKWIEVLAGLNANERKGSAHRGRDEVDGRGNVAFLDDDRDVVGLCTDLHSSINDAFLHEFLTRFPKVDRLYLRGTPDVTDEGLATLGQQSGLRKLTVVSPKVTDRGVARLAKLNRLESLFIRSDKVTDQSVETFAQLSALKQLSLLDTQITGDGLQRLKQALPKCSIHADHLTK
jgi:hypothetical protein